MQHLRWFFNEERAKILAHKDAAIALRRIASNMQRSYLTVQNILKVHANQSQKPCSGRNPLVSGNKSYIFPIIGISFIIYIQNFKYFF